VQLEEKEVALKSEGQFRCLPLVHAVGGVDQKQDCRSGHVKRVGYDVRLYGLHLNALAMPSFIISNGRHSAFKEVGQG
jgi:hypothetical protein